MTEDTCTIYSLSDRRKLQQKTSELEIIVKAATHVARVLSTASAWDPRSSHAETYRDLCRQQAKALHEALDAVVCE